jgi:hypothetical protein
MADAYRIAALIVGVLVMLMAIAGAVLQIVKGTQP